MSAVKLVSVRGVQSKIIYTEAKIQSISQLNMRETRVLQVKGIYAVKNVRPPKCIEGACASCRKIDVEISYIQKGVKFVVVMDVILKKNLQDLLLVRLKISPSRVRAMLYTINWSTILTISIVQLLVVSS